MLLVGVCLYFIISTFTISKKVSDGCFICGRNAEALVGYSFTILGIFFFIWGVLILILLKIYFLEFYTENKWIVFMATMGLCLSSVLRGSLDLIRFYNSEFRDFLENNEIIYNFLIFFFCDTIPQCFQLSTLIFGYIRRRNDKRYRLIINHSRESNLSALLNSELTDSQSNEFQQSYFDPPLR